MGWWGVKGQKIRLASLSSTTSNCMTLGKLFSLNCLIHRTL